MKGTMSVIFYLNKRKKKDEKYKIYGRVIVGRIKREFTTIYYIHPKDWNEKKGRAKYNAMINDELSDKENEINKIRRRILDQKGIVTAKRIVEYLKNKNHFDNYLIQYFDSYLNEMIAKNDIVANTIKQ